MAPLPPSRWQSRSNRRSDKTANTLFQMKSKASSGFTMRSRVPAFSSNVHQQEQEQVQESFRVGEEPDSFPEHRGRAGSFGLPPMPPPAPRRRKAEQGEKVAEKEEAQEQK